MLACLAGQHDLLDQFKTGADPYAAIASEFYGRQITKSDQAERGVGKQLTLSCGYGCGARKFRITAALGTYGPPVQLDDDTAAAAIRLYRQRNGAIVNYWRQAELQIRRLLARGDDSWGPLTVHDGNIYLPNGAPLLYHTLDFHTDPETGKQGYRIKTRYGHTWIYGAKLVENVVQALARLVLSQAMLRINAAGLRILFCSHDEIVVLIPNDCATEAFEFCMAEMQRPPEWLPDLPLGAEGVLGPRYNK